jgi:DNA-binding HxlR family transcriptional regulator
VRVGEIGGMACPTARTVGLIGDTWALLVLRELFLRSRRFDEFRAYTQMAPYLLSNRLAKLVREGIVDRVRYQDRPARYEYRLTEKGLDLYPIIVSMTRWGDRWATGEGEPLAHLVHKRCRRAMTPTLTCSECGEPMEARDVRVEMGPSMASERRAMRARPAPRRPDPEVRADDGVRHEDRDRPARRSAGLAAAERDGVHD